MLALGVLACGYGVKWFGEWSAQQLECNHVPLPAEALPGVGPLRIAFFADVHQSPELFLEIVEKLETARPDVIIFGGDFVTMYQVLTRSRWTVTGFRRLSKVAPVFAVMGNHDYEKMAQVERVYASAGVQLLRNKAVDWTTPSGSTLRIIGLGDRNEGDEAPWDCMQRMGQSPHPVLLVSHDPESRWLLRGYDWDVMLSGHNHGGQIGNPFTGEFISFRSSMPAGLYPFEGNRHVFVTRGVGAIYDMRFFCPPEVNIIEIK